MMGYLKLFCCCLAISDSLTPNLGLSSVFSYPQVIADVSCLKCFAKVVIVLVSKPELKYDPKETSEIKWLCTAFDISSFRSNFE